MNVTLATISREFNILKENPESKANTWNEFEYLIRKLLDSI